MSLRNKDFIAAGKYKAIRKIGSGSFGEIYTGINTTNGEVSGMLSRMRIFFVLNQYCMLSTVLVPISFLVRMG